VAEIRIQLPCSNVIVTYASEQERADSLAGPSFVGTGQAARADQTGFTMASVWPHTRSPPTPRRDVGAGQDGCAARDLNPEPAARG